MMSQLEKRIEEIDEIHNQLIFSHIDAHDVQIERTEKSGEHSRKEVKITITIEGYLGKGDCDY